MSVTRALPRVTYVLAERHEALWLRLKALVDQVAATAHRHPAKPASEATRAVAEAILAESRVFLPRAAREKLPVAAPDWGGLLTQLGQALALLEAYEAQNTGYDRASGARMWRGTESEFPVRRLAPNIVIKHPKIGMSREIDYEKELGKRITAVKHQEYDRGFMDGQRAARLKRLRAGLVDPDEKEDLIAPPKIYPRVHVFD